ncbi:uncharacterized protein LOC108911715 [Anoplophora glabripennis]|uniref:uncharacterized protein LOC108911715 n=1 Tax=Anoplophora glabripennis TaxID=217634 RepID=UPI000875A066|nr:uncharacterized protein LOC108911715 [Anoplophora glabripennis]
MSGVVFIIYVPTENYEKSLQKKVTKRVTIDESYKNSMQEENHHVIENVDDDFIPLCDSTISNANEGEPLEKTLRDILKQFHVDNSFWSKNVEDNYLQVVFSIESSDRCEDILEILRENGIGHRQNSIISVIPCTLHYHGHENEDNEKDSLSLDDGKLESNEEHHEKHTAWNRFLTSVKARLTVAQVVENVKHHAVMTFDFVFLLLISTTMCAIGLVENSNLCLLSSMLICPMMGPVMAATFGSVIKHKRLTKIGVQNELIGLGIATVVGFCYGTLICLLTDKYGNHTWPTYEMLSRGELRSLWVGCLIALLSGAAVALGILSDNFASLVGVAISTSLTPPAVNAGLLWSLASVYYVKGNETTRYHRLTQTNYYSRNYATELFALGAVSICLTFINIVCIYAAAILVFKIKEVAPMSRDHARRRFWKHDIKIARDYNKTLEGEEAGCTITKLSQELAAYRKSRFNPDKFYHSTELAKDNLKLNIKRPEFTWSPCTRFLETSREVNEIYESLKKYKPNTARVLDFTRAQPTAKMYQRRLSQIFLKDDDKLDIIKEDNSDKTTSSAEYSCGCQNNGKQYCTGKKRFTVVRCETDPLSPKP